MPQSPSIPPPADLDAVRESYDRAADNYVAMGMGDLEPHVWLRGVLDGFADSVRDVGPVLDVGCGPGQVTAYLSRRGLAARGVDLSPRMVEHARRRFPELAFEVASATDFRVEDASLGGVMGWWSLFHLPRAVLPVVLARFHRTLKPGGFAIVATHVGTDHVERREAYGVPVHWTSHRWMPEQLVALMADAGFEPVAELRLPATGPVGPGVVLVGQRTGRAGV